MNEGQEVRARALELALQAAARNHLQHNCEKVVDIAKNFEIYIQGQVPKKVGRPRKSGKPESDILG